MKRFLFYAIAAVLLALFVVIMGSAANATTNDSGEPHRLVVDGVTYTEPTKVVGSGPTIHWETPDTNPDWAYSTRHYWEGNGSEHLPCPGGIHWIDNKNVLTISHCLETPGTTTTSTTEPPTTTLPPSTSTTTVPETTTTTKTPTTTTSSTSSSTSTTVGPTTSIPPACDQEDPTTPCGGISTGGGACATSVSGSDWVPWVAVFLGLGTMALAGSMLYGTRRER